MKSLIVSILLLSLTVIFMGGSTLKPLLLHLVQLDWYWTLLLVTAALLNNLISSYRFFLVVAPYSRDLICLSDALRVSFAGLFLAYWTPISIVGDGARAFWVTKRIGTHYGKAAWLVLLDRLFALIALLAFMTPFIPLYLNRLSDEGVMVFAAGATLCLFLVLSWWWLRAGIPERIVKLFQGLKRLMGMPKNITAHIVVGASYVLSYFVLLVIAGYALKADISMYHLLAYAPLLFLAQNLPISFGGLGSRELAFLIVLGGITGKSTAVAMALIVGLSFVLAALPGIFFVGELRKGTSDKT